jgi:DNA polymerase III subunit delta'
VAGRAGAAGPVTALRWERVVGQDQAVALLQSAARRPVHSYLLVGPRGSGVEEAARCFAATLVAGDDERSWELVLRGEHPDVVEIDPSTTQIVKDDADRLVRECHASPIEGDRKVVMLLGAERLNDIAANRLLKTIEEPPARAHLVLVAERAEALLATIRSRCQRVDFAYLPESTVRDAVTGVDDDRRALVARLAGGRVDRARDLAGPIGGVRDATLTAAGALDGTGAAAARGAAAIDLSVRRALEEVELTQAADLEQLEADLTAAGYPARVAQARRRVMTDRHKRELRRARTDAWIEAITALEAWLRDALAGPEAPRLNVDRDPASVAVRPAVVALDACRKARNDLIEFNANESLTMERLLLHVPTDSSRGS